jgi:putative redox protein
MVEIHLSYSGELRCHGVHGPSGASLDTDAPKDNQGRGESFSPTDLVATALGACMLTIMGLRARKLGVALEGAAVTVTKEMVADPLRRIGRLRVRMALPDCAPELRASLEEAARTCPVTQSLDPRIDVPIHFGWGERVPAGT